MGIASRLAHFYRDFCKTCKRIRMKLAISTSFFASVLGQAPGGAAQYLYCINANNHGSNPRMLPNNMCCPFYEQAGIKGKPYHSAVQRLKLSWRRVLDHPPQLAFSALRRKSEASQPFFSCGMKLFPEARTIWMLNR